MSQNAKLDEIQELVLNATKIAISDVATQYSNKEVYAFVIYSCSAFEAIGVAYSIRESMKKIIASGIASQARFLERMKESSPETYERYRNTKSNDACYEVTSDEWEFMNAGDDTLFSRLAKEISEIYDVLHEGGLEYEDIYRIIEDLITEVIVQLRDEGAFRNAAFEDDILLGIHFSDPDDDEVEMVRRVSEKVNSDYWHQRVCKGFQQYTVDL